MIDKQIIYQFSKLSVPNVFILHALNFILHHQSFNEKNTSPLKFSVNSQRIIRLHKSSAVGMPSKLFVDISIYLCSHTLNKLLRRGWSSRVKIYLDFWVFSNHRPNTHAPESCAATHRLSSRLKFFNIRRWRIRSSLWDAAISLTRVSLFTRSQTPANFGCIAVTSWSVNFIFPKYFHHIKT